MIAESVVQFDDVLALAYRLSPLEKVKLVKRMADALEHEPVLAIDTPSPMLASSEQTWGQQALALLDTFDTNDWQAIDMPDVVEWVKQQRAQQDKQRGLIWENEE